MKRGRGSKRTWALLILASALFVTVRLMDGPVPFFTYRLVDDRTLIVETVTGPGSVTRVTSVTETSSMVTIGISSFRVPLPGSGDDRLELVVTLNDPLGDRVVFDAIGGQAISRR